MTDLRSNKQDDPELEKLIRIRNKIRNQYISDIKNGKTSHWIQLTPYHDSHEEKEE
jgi:hypothetical protein